MVSYDYDVNSILAHAMKDCTAKRICNTWQHLHDIYKFATVAPNIYLLDKELELDLKTTGTDYQLITPYSHRNNLAERAIQTWRNHFKAGLAT